MSSSRATLDFFDLKDKNIITSNRNIIVKDIKIFGIECNKRFNLTCQNCFSEIRTEAHHIFYRSTYPKLSLSLNNSILLCRMCHIEVHGKNITYLGRRNRLIRNGLMMVSDLEKTRLHKLCILEEKEMKCKYHKKYQESENGKIVIKKYRQSEKVKISQKKYRQSENGKIVRKKYYQSNKGKITYKEHNKKFRVKYAFPRIIKNGIYGLEGTQKERDSKWNKRYRANKKKLIIKSITSDKQKDIF